MLTSRHVDFLFAPEYVGLVKIISAVIDHGFF
jgi:hypothetical protein